MWQVLVGVHPGAELLVYQDWMLNLIVHCQPAAWVGVCPQWPPRSLTAVCLKQHLGYVETGFCHSSAGKESACNAGDPSSIPGLGRSPGEGIGYPLQYSGLENFMDNIVHGIPKSWTRLSDFHFTSGCLVFSFQLFWGVYRAFSLWF